MNGLSSLNPIVFFLNNSSICMYFNQWFRNYLHLSVAAAAKSLQSCPTLCNPRDSSPPGSPVPGILQARILEWVAISFSSAWRWKVKVKSLSGVQLFETPWTAAYQAPPSMGFSRQEYLSGVPLPSQTYQLGTPFTRCLTCVWASQVVLAVKNPPAQSLGQEDPLGKGNDNPL